MSIDDDHVRMIWAYAWEHASAQEDVTKVWDECRGSASAAPAWRVWGSFASAGSVSRTCGNNVIPISLPSF